VSISARFHNRNLQFLENLSEIWSYTDVIKYYLLIRDTVSSQTSHNPYSLWAFQWVLIKPSAWLDIFWRHDTTTWGITSRLSKGMTERDDNKIPLHAMDMQALKRVDASRTLQAF